MATSSTTEDATTELAILQNTLKEPEKSINESFFINFTCEKFLGDLNNFTRKKYKGFNEIKLFQNCEIDKNIVELFGDKGFSFKEKQPYWFYVDYIYKTKDNKVPKNTRCIMGYFLEILMPSVLQPVDQKAILEEYKKNQIRCSKIYNVNRFLMSMKSENNKTYPQIFTYLVYLSLLLLDAIKIYYELYILNLISKKTENNEIAADVKKIMFKNEDDYTKDYLYKFISDLSSFLKIDLDLYKVDIYETKGANLNNAFLQYFSSTNEIVFSNLASEYEKKFLDLKFITGSNENSLLDWAQRLNSLRLRAVSIGKNDDIKKMLIES